MRSGLAVLFWSQETARIREDARSERQRGEFEMKALSVLFDALTFLKNDSLLHPSLQT